MDTTATTTFNQQLLDDYVTAVSDAVANTKSNFEREGAEVEVTNGMVSYFASAILPSLNDDFNEIVNRALQNFT